MATGLQSWSKTASSNANADSAVNFAEGMAPSAVNDSGRGLMAAAAKWRDDNAGMITTGGTSTAFTATSNQSLGLVDGTTITLQMSATSGATPTLNVDSGGAKAIQGVSGTAIPTGALVSGGIYTFVYRSSPDAWIAQGRFAPNEFASGVVMVFYQDSAPTGWTINTTNTNDVALRVVSGSGAGGGTGGALGGTTAFTTVFASRTILKANLPSYNLDVTDPGHVHTVNAPTSKTSDAGTDNGVITNVWRNETTESSVSATTGITVASGGSGTAIDFAVKYASVIICSKA
jgi:hypothetical protein